MKTKILLSLVALLFVSVLVLLYLNLQKPTLPIVSLPTPTTVPTQTTDWKTYENKELGFSFEYPQEFSVNDEIDTGETGKYFGLSLDKGQNPRILLGGISSDYSAGRSGFFTDTQGYRKSQSKVFIKFVNDKERLITPPLLQNVSKNKNQVEIVRVTGQSDSFETSGPGDPGKNNFGAFINLPNKTFTGIAIIHMPGYDQLTDSQYEHILSTFKFTDSSDNLVTGLQLNKCCPCPTKISSSQIGQDSWVLYQSGKDYSSQIPKTCGQIQCQPCQNSL